MVNPFDLRTALLAKHAQHVVLIHFSIGRFITAVGFDLIAQWTKRRDLPTQPTTTCSWQRFQHSQFWSLEYSRGNSNSRTRN